MEKKERISEAEEKQITPSQYFDILKNGKNTITTEALKNSFDVFVKLGEKYKKLGQRESMKKLCFLAETLAKEEKLIELGVDTFVYKDTIEDYIENVSDKAVKIVELSRYMREVPDELVDIIEKTKEYFDEYYVVFTDYTNKEERKVEKERRDKDPILFGAFKNSHNVSDRFYFLGDWVDEYCDLTLDKMITEYKEKKEYSPALEIKIPETSSELVELLNQYSVETNRNEDYAISSGNISLNNDMRMDRMIPIDPFTLSNKDKKDSFFTRIRTIFKK